MVGFIDFPVAITNQPRNPRVLSEARFSGVAMDMLADDVIRFAVAEYLDITDLGNLLATTRLEPGEPLPYWMHYLYIRYGRNSNKPSRLSLLVNANHRLSLDVFSCRFKAPLSMRVVC